MKFAIIAAGEGSRLVNEGVDTPKPLVRISGEPMIDRLIRIFAINGASSVSIIINNEMREVYEHVSKTKAAIPLNIIRRSTPSSMHSFHELSHTLGNERFCLTTVDTIFRENEFAEFINTFRKIETDNNDGDDSISPGIDGLMAVTGFIDDEKPLYVETDNNMMIKGFHDESHPGAGYISGGIYCLVNNSLPILNAAIESGVSRMRNYQRLLVERGLLLKAYPFTKIIDVDHQEDIFKAELFLSETQKTE